MTEDAGDEFGVIPVLFFEGTRQSLVSYLITLAILVPEIVECPLSFSFLTYHPSFFYPLGKEEVIAFAGKDLIEIGRAHV